MSALLVFPTRVGMDRILSCRLTILRCIPHTRGDGPNSRVQAMSSGEYSPHAWGWTALIKQLTGGDTVFPTREGMDREYI